MENPKYLYRYRPIGTSLAYTLREVRGHIHLSRHDKLNDPFDGLQRGTTVQKEARLGKQTWSVEQTWGVACFTEVWDNPVMWAHYADNYSGICLQYDFAKLQKDLELQQKSKGRNKGQYVEIETENHIRRVEYKALDVEFDDEVDAICTKTLHWAHEKEWRIVGRDAGIAHRALEKIIFGPNTDHSSRLAILETARSTFPLISDQTLQIDKDGSLMHLRNMRTSMELFKPQP